jgi:hypothetical protein
LNLIAKTTSNRVISTKLVLIACLFALSGIPGTARAVDVTLAWDVPTGASFSGYKLYYDGDDDMEMYQGVGADQGDSPVIIYNEDLDDPDAPTITLTGLNEGQYYYFTVTAFVADGIESNYSNEVGLMTAGTDNIGTGSDGSGTAGADSSTGDVAGDSSTAGGSGGGGGCFISMAANHGKDSAVTPALLLLLGAAALLVSHCLRRKTANRTIRDCSLMASENKIYPTIAP